jgi:hypothetical protein
MKKIRILSISLILIAIIGLILSIVVIAQTSEEDVPPRFSFQIESEIGRALPRKIIYDPIYDRYAVVDAYNRLMLVDAQTFQTQHILYETGQYNDLLFSHNGNWFALAINQRIELYNANTGEMVSRLDDLSEALSVVGPLAFSRDDNLLKFEGIYRAPRSIRVRENQTIQVPWIWNLTAARNEGDSTFPRRLEAWQFFDYRNGFVLGPHDTIVAALPGRLQIIDANTLQQQFDIPTDRYETDPMDVWFSLHDDKIYVQPIDEQSLVQVDTERGVLVETPLNQALTETDLELLSGIELSDQAKVIGGRNTDDLKKLLLGDSRTQRDRYGRGNLTVTLVDLIVPPAFSEDNIVAFIFVFNERTETGYFELKSPGSQMILSPEESNLLVRTWGDNERIITYNIETGDEIRRLTPSLRAIGAYNRNNKNRVLDFNAEGDVLISDFQRYDAQTNAVLAEDLRYSRRFDSFYFTNDSQNIITLSSNEWRVWNRTTGEVLRREVLNFEGNIIREADDGFHFLTRFSRWVNNGRVLQTGVEIVNLQNSDSYDNVGNGITRKSIIFDEIRGSSIDRIIPSPDWQHFLITYSVNSWGEYPPGNQIAMYHIDEGRLWFITGDDLPPSGERNYGWVDNETVFISGNGYAIDDPARVFDADYHVTGLPQCIVEQFPDQVETWVDLWERLVYRLRNDALHDLTNRICANVPDTSAEIEHLLIPTATPLPVTVTPIRVEGVPVCLTARYPSRVPEYTQLWHDITEGLSADEIRTTRILLCDGIGEIPKRYPSIGGAYIDQTMLIHVRTGERSTGAFIPVDDSRPSTEPLRIEFEKQTERSLGQFIVSPDKDLVASSNLPGELVIYKLVTSFDTLLTEATATAQVAVTARNQIGAAPSPTPTFNHVGTARPTLTPTTTPTPYPTPSSHVDMPQQGEVIDLCPAEILSTLANAPDTYAPSGMIIAPVFGDTLWTIDPITGERAPNETVPQCGSGIDCQLSPDKQWILARATNVAYVVRPDGSDNRRLFGSDDPEEYVYVPDITWAGANSIEYWVEIRLEINGRYHYFDAIQRDILGVYPDPEPWIPFVSVNELPTEIVARQPGGSLAVVRTQFSTGISAGYKYYLHDINTDDSIYFARTDDSGLSVRWLPLGDRFVYRYHDDKRRLPYYQYTSIGEHDYLGQSINGTMSNEGRYVAYSTDRRAQPMAVWDSETGLTRTYCLPETGARFYDGQFVWSPDSNYIALRTFLPKDEDDEDVGQHLMILNIETGEVLDLSTGFGQLVIWARDAGTYGEGN